MVTSTVSCSGTMSVNGGTLQFSGGTVFINSGTLVMTGQLAISPSTPSTSTTVPSPTVSTTSSSSSASSPLPSSSSSSSAIGLLQINPKVPNPVVQGNVTIKGTVMGPGASAAQIRFGWMSQDIPPVSPNTWGQPAIINGTSFVGMVPSVDSAIGNIWMEVNGGAPQKIYSGPAISVTTISSSSSLPSSPSLPSLPSSSSVTHPAATTTSTSNSISSSTVVLVPPPVTTIWIKPTPLDPNVPIEIKASGLAGFIGKNYPTDQIITLTLGKKAWSWRGCDPTPFINKNAVMLSSLFGEDGKTPVPGRNTGVPGHAYTAANPATPDFTTYTSALAATKALSSINGGAPQILIRRGSCLTSAHINDAVGMTGSSWNDPAMFLPIGVGGWSDRSAPDPVVLTTIAVGEKYSFNFILLGEFNFDGSASAAAAAGYGLNIVDGNVNGVQSGNFIVQGCSAVNCSSLCSIASNSGNNTYQIASGIFINNRCRRIYGNRFGLYTASVWDLTCVFNEFYQVGWDFKNLPKDGSGQNHDAYTNPAIGWNESKTIIAILEPQHRYIGNLFCAPESIGLKDIAGGVICDNYFLACPIGLVAVAFNSAIGHNVFEGDAEEFDLITSASATNNAGQLVTQSGTPGLALSNGPAGNSTQEDGWERGTGMILGTQKQAWCWKNLFIKKTGPTPNNDSWVVIQPGDSNSQGADPPITSNVYFADNVVYQWWMSNWDQTTPIPALPRIDLQGGKVGLVTYSGTNYIPGMTGVANVVSTTPTVKDNTFTYGKWGAANGISGGGPATAQALTTNRCTLHSRDAVDAAWDAYEPITV